ncbi:MAG: hypothetical protein ACYDCL_23610 [Myxococcales bacterium]
MKTSRALWLLVLAASACTSSNPGGTPTTGGGPDSGAAPQLCSLDCLSYCTSHPYTTTVSSVVCGGKECENILCSQCCSAPTAQWCCENSTTTGAASSGMWFCPYNEAVECPGGGALPCSYFGGQEACGQQVDITNCGMPNPVSTCEYCCANIAGTSNNYTCSEDPTCCAGNSGAVPGQATGILCNGKCVDDLDDLYNCGSCGNFCGGGDGQCRNGSCYCVKSDETMCPHNKCVNLGSDDGNCGSCGNACPAGETCSGGQCSCGGAQCSGGQTCQNGQCVCPPTMSFLNGQCSCPPGSLENDAGFCVCSNGGNTPPACQCPMGAASIGGQCVCAGGAVDQFIPTTGADNEPPGSYCVCPGDAGFLQNSALFGWQTATAVCGSPQALFEAADSVACVDCQGLSYCVGAYAESGATTGCCAGNALTTSCSNQPGTLGDPCLADGGCLRGTCNNGTCCAPAGQTFSSCQYCCGGSSGCRLTEFWDGGDLGGIYYVAQCVGSGGGTGGGSSGGTGGGSDGGCPLTTCSSDAQCPSGDDCAVGGAGTPDYCRLDCMGGKACPTGWACLPMTDASGVNVRDCVPLPGTCP